MISKSPSATVSIDAIRYAPPKAPGVHRQVPCSADGDENEVCGVESASGCPDQTSTACSNACSRKLGQLHSLRRYQLRILWFSYTFSRWCLTSSPQRCNRVNIPPELPEGRLDPAGVKCLKALRSEGSKDTEPLKDVDRLPVELPGRPTELSLLSGRLTCAGRRTSLALTDSVWVVLALSEQHATPHKANNAEPDPMMTNKITTSMRTPLRASTRHWHRRQVSAVAFGTTPAQSQREGASKAKTNVDCFRVAGSPRGQMHLQRYWKASEVSCRQTTMVRATSKVVRESMSTSGASAADCLAAKRDQSPRLGFSFRVVTPGLQVP